MPETKLSTLLDKSFLNGDGTLSIRGDKDALSTLLQSDAPFSDDNIDEILILDLKASPAKDLTIGDAKNLALGVKANASVAVSLDIIQKGDQKGVELLKEYGLELKDDTMYLAFRTDAEASVGAELKGKWAQYGLSGSFGVEAGGEVHFAYLRPFTITEHTARGTLKTFFEHLRLPQNVQHVKDIPEPGEVLRLTYGGYLNASAGLSWGYSMTRSTGFSLRDLDLQQKIFLEAKAKLGLAFGLAGNFEVEVRRARDDDENWARVTVKKARSRSFEFAADLSVKADLDTKGLPDKPSEFLEGILGLRATDLINQINGYVDQFTDTDPNDVIDKLKEKADGLGKHFIDDFTNRVLGKTLDKISSNEDIQQLHQWLVDIKKTHDDLGAKVVGFLEDELDVVDVGALIDKLKAATDDLKDAAGLQKLTDSKVWRLLEVLVDKEWIDLIENTDEAFDDLKKKIEALEKANLDRLKTFIDAKKEALNLGPLLDKLASVDPDDLKKDVNKHLQDLLERLTGIGAKELKKLNFQEIRDVQKKVKDLKGELKTFTDKLYKQFKEALNNSYKLSLAYRYRFASEKDALLDVEINLAAIEEQQNGVTLPSGAVLMREAINGDFREVFKFASADRVVIRKGVLSHKVTRSHELSINLFGWKSSRTEQLITNVTDVIEQRDDGVMHVYGIEAESISKRKRRDEETEQNLAFKVMAEGFQPIGADHDRAIDAVTAMSSSYNLRIKDLDTSRKELREYLEFADQIGLIPPGYGGIDEYLDEIAGELGLSGNDSFGSATLKYHLRYDAAALLNVFQSLATSQLRAVSRITLRTVAHFAYIDFDPFRGVAEAYVEPAMRNANLKTNLSGSRIFNIPTDDGQIKKIQLSNHERRILEVLYGLEDDFIDELLKLDEIMDEASGGQKPKIDRLTKQLRKFIGFQKELNKWIGFNDRAAVPPLIAVLNRLTGVATQKPRTWRTTLEMKFEVDDKTITKLLVA